MDTVDLTILAIDDDRFNLTTLRAVVTDRLPGARFLTAPNGLLGIELARAEEPDVILLDILMPGMDGYAVCRTLKEDEGLQIIPVLFLTALGTDHDSHIKALEAGAEGFLSKPFNEIELVAQIRAMAKIKEANLRQRLEKEELIALLTRRNRTLEQSAERHRAILQTAMDGFMIVDLQGRVLDVNEAYCRMSGYSARELLTMRLSDLKTGETPEATVARLQQFMAQGESCFESRHRRKDGSLFDLEISIQYRPADGGQFVGFLRDITERKRVQDRLRETEEIFSRFMEHSPVYVFFKDENLRVVRLSRNYETLLGKPLAELLGKSMEELFPAEMASRMIANDLRIMQEDQPGTVEEEFNGRSYTTTKFPILFEGKPRYLAGYTMDVTERRQAEQTLRRERDRAQQYLDTVETIIVALDAEGRIVLINRRGCKLLGRSEEELRGQSWFDTCLPQPDGREKVYPYFRLLMAGELAAAEYVENPVVTRSGEQRQIAWHNVLLRDEQGKITGTLSSGEDVTERRRAEEEITTLLRAVQQEKTTLSALIGSITDEVWFADDRGRFTLVNPSALKAFGLLPDQVVAVKELVSTLEVFRPDGSLRPVEEAPPLRALAGEVVINQEEIVRIPATGELRYRLVNAAPVRNFSNSIFGAVAVVKDITERHQLEQELKEMVSLLEKRNAELERFTYTVSHDLKSPLVTILGFIGQLEQDLENDERDYIKADFAFIQDAAHKMHDLLASLLDLSRAGRPIGEPQPVDLPVLVRQVTEQMASQLNQVKLRVAMPDDLPVVRGDPVRLREVFQNLLENAAKFMTGQPEPLIEVGGAAGDGEVRCWVRDNGIGIPDAYQKRIFNLFEKLDPSVEGTGIGLAIVRRIVEEHGGMVWVESAGEGCGSTFFFILPAETASYQP